MTDGRSTPLLRAEGLEKEYSTADGLLDRLLHRAERVRAVADVDLEIYEGETLGLVGESGCGKTTLGRLLVHLVEPTAGSVTYRDDDLTALSDSALRARRTELQYVFQNPLASLNPRLTVGDIVGEALEIHDVADSRTDRDRRVRELLEAVGLEAAHANRYPSELSGGQRQRVAIARSLAVEPSVLVCDEPVSALDPSVQAEILALLADLQEAFDLTLLFISHDLSVVEHVADRIAVMYLGELVEVGPTEAVFADPSHPYTEALVSAIPEPDPLWEGDRIVLEGTVPSPTDPPAGCPFHTRCHRVIPPDSFDLDPRDFRGVLRLRKRLEEADSRPGRDDVDDPASIRAAFEIPDPLPDPDAEAALLEALETLAAGEVDAASRLLADAFATPCERRCPTLRSVEDEYAVETDGRTRHTIACHRFGHDERD
ncbi:ABC transporter ATP-binding protein [Natrialbaceae archaeon GCM10025810]|uniref:ABC transporter ATP-binding protein n=1 Tax=Halovalidus salilacus TaxID=3075124 RepID=UPI00361920CC